MLYRLLLGRNHDENCPWGGGGYFYFRTLHFYVPRQPKHPVDERLSGFRVFRLSVYKGAACF